MGDCRRTDPSKGRRAERGEVVSRFVAENGNPNTASTQYQHWKSHYENLRKGRSANEERAEPGNVERCTLTIGPDGRLLIPARMREAMLLGSSGRVTARVVDGELTIISPQAALRQVQRMAQKYKKPGESVVDEFLAERRAMWGEE